MLRLMQIPFHLSRKRGPSLSLRQYIHDQRRSLSCRKCQTGERSFARKTVSNDHSCALQMMSREDLCVKQNPLFEAEWAGYPAGQEFVIFFWTAMGYGVTWYYIISTCNSTIVIVLQKWEASITSRSLLYSLDTEPRSPGCSSIIGISHSSRPRKKYMTDGIN